MKRLVPALVLLFALTACQFTLAPAATESPVPADPVEVESLDVEILEIGPKPAIQVSVSGELVDGCYVFDKQEGSIQQTRVGNTFSLVLTPTLLEGGNCLVVPQPFELHIGLDYDQLEPGEYVVDVNGVRTSFTLESPAGMSANEMDTVLASVKADLAGRGVDPETVDFLSFTPTDWPDGCLGLPAVGEECPAESVSGFLILVGDGQQEWEYHTNADGSQLRMQPIE
jgi:hypothetical protein